MRERWVIPTGHVILVDAGAGLLFGPTLNKQDASLRAAGATPEQVTDIFITHMHPDHIGGLMKGSQRAFPNATVHVEQKEIGYYLNANNRAQAPAAAKMSFESSELMLQPYVKAGKVKTFSGATSFFPGFSSLPTWGHTPGHTSYVLESQGEKLVILGDQVHVAEVQLPDPDVTIGFDFDPALAAETRKKMLRDAAAAGYWVAGNHIPFPGIGHVRAEGQGFRWIPTTFVDDCHR